MKLFIGRSVWRGIEVAHDECYADLIAHCHNTGQWYTRGTVRGDALISRSRSICASAFLRSEADVLLTLDGDIWFPPAAAIQVAEAAMDYDIVGALYMTRSLNTQPAIMLPPDQPIVFQEGQPLAAVPFLSTGFLAVHRRVFERLAEDLPLCHQGWEDQGEDQSFWPFYMPFCIPWPGDGHMYLSEDWAFCQRAKDAGFTCYLDPSIRLGHMGDVLFTLEDLLHQRPPAQPLKLVRNAEGRLQTYTEQPIPEPALAG